MSVDWFLVLMIVATLVILLLCNVYVLVHFQHPADKNEALFPKFLVLIGFTLAQVTVLLLPLDVANKEGYAGCDGFDTEVCGGLNMELIWEIVYVAILVYVVVLIPFAIFYYEADESGVDESKRSNQLCEALKYTFAVVLVSGLVLVMMYIYLSTTEIPLSTFTIPVTTTNYLTMEPNTFPTDGLADCGVDDLNVAKAATEKDTILSMNVTFPIYVVAMLGFVGWFFFVIFAGVGLAALPIDLICAFIYRPRHMDAVEVSFLVLKKEKQAKKQIKSHPQ